MKPGFLMVLWKKSNPDAEGPLVRQKKILPEELRSQLCHAAMRTTVISPWFDEAVNRGFTNHQVSAEGKEILTYYTTTISVSVFLPHPQYQTPNLRISSGWGCVTPTPAGDISMAITHTHTRTHFPSRSRLRLLFQPLVQTATNCTKCFLAQRASCDSSRTEHSRCSGAEPGFHPAVWFPVICREKRQGEKKKERL